MTDESNPQSGSADENPASGTDQSPKDFVKHSSYAKAVSEAKSAKRRLAEAEARLNEFETQHKAEQEQKLLEEKNFQQVIDQLKADNESLKIENATHLQDKVDYRKLNAAMNVLQSKGITLEQKYLGLLPIDQIGLDEDGNIDSTSVANVIDDFQKEHPRLTLPKAQLLPNNKSGDSGSKLSVNEWKKLSREDQYKAMQEKRVNLDLA